MKKVLICVVVLLSFVSLTFAGSYFPYLGSRAGNMAGSFVSVADDPTAIYWCPGGLCQLSGSGVYVSGFFGNVNIKTNLPQNNASSIAPNIYNGDFPLPNIYGLVGVPAEPSTYGTGSDQSNSSFLMPLIAGYTRVGDVTLGISYYVVGGIGSTWKDSEAGALVPTDTVTASIDKLLGVTVANVTASKQITPEFGLGVGVNYLSMIDNTKVEKTYNAVTPTTVIPGVLNIDDYSLLSQQDGTGNALELTLGGLYKFAENLRLGVRIRTGANIKQTGTATYRASGLAASGLTAVSAGLIADADYKTGYTKNFAFPMVYEAGVSYDPIKELTLAFAATAENHSSLKDDITYDAPLPGVFENVNVNKGWRDIIVYKLGSEYRVNEKLAFQGGVALDPALHDNQTLNILDTTQFVITWVTLGATYNISPVTLGLTICNGFSDKPELNGRNYELPWLSYQLCAGYKF
jgi:long-chain fatty acid transport protein